ncbi:fascin-2 isoform X1 [Rhinolophus ferrumequinum]|uniref:fascin-2 isoform X1 n=1 Tax=Rhinolophus ferrumequinum TaxID=59479 RepID=UPI00140F96B3|nr:fascin-2 isoform X1 [Rhinolophus ferrumequinum]
MPTNGLHQVLKIQFGLVNDTDRYLTAESFGFKVNASAPSLKRKQIWVLEPYPGQGTAVLFRSSHLGRYLSAEEDGRVACEAERPGRDCRFLVLPQPDGRWVLQSEPHGRFFGGTEDRLSCFATAISPAELWTVHLAIHPQAHLLSVSRRRYAHLCPQEDEIVADSNTPWGVDALITLIFQNRQYCLKSCDSRYLRSDGRLVWEPEAHTRYTLEFKAGKLAFKDCDGLYLAPVGPTGTLRAGRNTRPSKDELFDLEESHPQVVMVAANHRYVSVRQASGLGQGLSVKRGLRCETASCVKGEAGHVQLASKVVGGDGVNVSANQDEELDHETFLMQIDRETRKCTFYSSTGGYWTLVTHGGIQATATQVSATTMFEMEWRGRRVALKASNGRYVCMKKNGQLAAISDFVGQDEEFILKLINRPILVLRGLDGFVCHRRGSNQLDTNRSVYDVFHLSFSDGAYQIRGRGGGFWHTGSHGSVCSDGERAEDFLFEFRERGRVAIRARSGKYLRGGASGLLRADADAPAGVALWEY